MQGKGALVNKGALDRRQVLADCRRLQHLSGTPTAKGPDPTHTGQSSQKGERPLFDISAYLRTFLN